MLITPLLNADDADFVDCIHTDSGLSLGMDEAICDVDIFVEWSSDNVQSACGRSLSYKTRSCNHRRALMLFKATLGGNCGGGFQGTPCKVKQGKTVGPVTVNEVGW